MEHAWVPAVSAARACRLCVWKCAGMSTVDMAVSAGRVLCWHGVHTCMGSCSVCSKGLRTVWWCAGMSAVSAGIHKVLAGGCAGMAHATVPAVFAARACRLCVEVCWHVYSQCWRAKGAGMQRVLAGLCAGMARRHAWGPAVIAARACKLSAGVLACLQSVLAFAGCWWEGVLAWRTCISSCSVCSKSL
jgi:phage shock protein PspC (stress-responsive transcriptional regulator)